MVCDPFFQRTGAAGMDFKRLVAYRRRWKIERTIAWVQNFRRLVVRYDRSIAMFNAQIQIACTIIAVNRL